MQFKSMLCTYNPSLFLLIRDLGTRNYLEHPLALEMVTANRFLHLIHASGYGTSDIQVKGRILPVAVICWKYGGRSTFGKAS